MSLFTWKPEYSVHDIALDSHHRHLFAMLNSVYEHVMNSTELDSVVPKIDELSDYTGYHFSAEEQHMRDTGYPGINGHIAQHREFTGKIKALRENYQNNDLEVTREFIIILGEWLLGHVLKEDRKYSE